MKTKINNIKFSVLFINLSFYNFLHDKGRVFDGKFPKLKFELEIGYEEEG
jgi:hypothetical protein